VRLADGIRACSTIWLSSCSPAMPSVSSSARAALPHYTVLGDDGQRSELVAFGNYNDPAFVLLQCEAIRQVVELHRSALELRRTDDPYQAGYIKAMRDDRVLRLIAVPYADHPAFRAEWGPDTQASK
jgi:hypothetical protein